MNIYWTLNFSFAVETFFWNKLLQISDYALSHSLCSCNAPLAPTFQMLQPLVICDIFLFLRQRSLRLSSRTRLMLYAREVEKTDDKGPTLCVDCSSIVDIGLCHLRSRLRSFNFCVKTTFWTFSWKQIFHNFLSALLFSMGLDQTKLSLDCHRLWMFSSAEVLKQEAKAKPRNRIQVEAPLHRSLTWGGGCLKMQWRQDHGGQGGDWSTAQPWTFGT